MAEKVFAAGEDGVIRARSPEPRDCEAAVKSARCEDEYLKRADECVEMSNLLPSLRASYLRMADLYRELAADEALLRGVRSAAPEKGHLS